MISVRPFQLNYSILNQRCPSDCIKAWTRLVSLTFPVTATISSCYVGNRCQGFQQQITKSNSEQSHDTHSRQQQHCTIPEVRELTNNMAFEVCIEAPLVAPLGSTIPAFLFQLSEGVHKSNATVQTASCKNISIHITFFLSTLKQICSPKSPFLRYLCDMHRPFFQVAARDMLLLGSSSSALSHTHCLCQTSVGSLMRIFLHLPHSSPFSRRTVTPQTLFLLKSLQLFNNLTLLSYTEHYCPCFSTSLVSFSQVPCLTFRGTETQERKRGHSQQV